MHCLAQVFLQDGLLVAYKPNVPGAALGLVLTQESEFGALKCIVLVQEDPP
jgi:hypothetical protein